MKTAILAAPGNDVDRSRGPDLQPNAFMSQSLITAVSPLFLATWFFAALLLSGDDNTGLPSVACWGSSTAKSIIYYGLILVC